MCRKSSPHCSINGHNFGLLGGQLCPNISGSYMCAGSIFCFLDTNTGPVQKKGLTRYVVNDNVHLERESWWFFGSSVHLPSGTGGRPGINQAVTGDLPDLVEVFSPQDGSKAAFEANPFKRRDLKKAELASESNASVPGRLRLNRWGPVPDCDWRTSITRRRPHTEWNSEQRGQPPKTSQRKEKTLCAQI